MKLAIIAIAIAFAFVIGNILFLLHMGKKPMLKPEDAAKVKKTSLEDSLPTLPADRETSTTSTLALINTHHDVDSDQISHRSRLSNPTNMDNALGKEHPNEHGQQHSEQSSGQSCDQSTDTSSSSAD